jgi:hypothetical protein
VPGEKAMVTLTHPDGTVEESELEHDGYMVLTGPGKYIAHENHFPGTGTVIITIKRQGGEAG